MFSVTWAWSRSLDNTDKTIQKAIDAKLGELTDKLFAKVMENVSGKILQKRTGQLADSIHRKIVTTETRSTGEVFVEPETEKAWALEQGGKDYYQIVPTKARILRFVGKDGEMVFAPYVKHPPSKAFRYLGEAFDEVAPTVPEEFNRALTEALNAL